jgi:aryl-alcohol dehydrogenase-like predicted oxidoreductase
VSDLFTKNFGRSGPAVTRVGLGGEGVLRTFGREAEAKAVIESALAEGITYFDCAAAYAGSQGYYGLVWGERPDQRARVFQASKSAGRMAAEARADLENTLAVMRLDHLDLWQIHDLRTEADFETISGPGGALEFFVRARDKGLVRHIGVTGHHDPRLLTRAVREWPLDAVLLPINPVEAVLGGFMDETVPVARERGLAVIAMKVLGAGHYLAPRAGVTAEVLLSFALAQNPDVVIVGCRTPDEVRTLAQMGREARPLTAPEQTALVEVFRTDARRLGFYRAYA